LQLLRGGVQPRRTFARFRDAAGIEQRVREA
jgi:hypothetical protein